MNYSKGQIGIIGYITELELITANGHVCGPYGAGGKYTSIEKLQLRLNHNLIQKNNFNFYHIFLKDMESPGYLFTPGAILNIFQVKLNNQA